MIGGTAMGSSRRPLLLVQPSSGYWDVLQGVGLPLSVLHAAARVNLETPVHLLDLRRRPGWRRELSTLLRETRPRMVGISAMIGPQLTQAIEITRLAHRLVEDVTVVWGGVFPSLCPGLVFSEPGVDLVVVGDGEQTLQELARDLAAGGTGEGVPGVIGRGGPTGSAPASPRPPVQLDDLPPLPYWLLDRDRYTGRFEGGGVISLESSRGCPGACSFCYNPTFCGSRWRPRSVGRVEEDLQHLHRFFSPRRLFLMDDNFFADPDRGAAVADLLGRATRSWGTHGLCPSTAVGLDDHYLAHLADTGCNELKIGVENVSDRNQALMGKRFDRKRFRAFNARAAQFEIDLHYSFILGFPGETIDSIEENVEYAFTLLKENRRASLFMMNTLFPYPGTPLYEEHTGRDWKERWGLEEYGRFEINCSGGPWLDPQLESLLANVGFVSMFVSGRGATGPRSLRAPLQALRRVYRPLARHRLRHLSFDLAPEVEAGRWLLDRAARGLR